MDDSSLDVRQGIEPPGEINPRLTWAANVRTSPDQLAEQLLAGDRDALSRAITLTESTLESDRKDAIALLDRILPHRVPSWRIGITGSPGVGKSSFIEKYGTLLLADGHRVAVLAIDPTSPRTGGSILGDKSRMSALAHDDRAFVRPSPSRGALGGVAHRTREAILLCEAAGYDRILIETVGVGQSEIAVSDLVDCFVLLLQPGAGDELQGMKRGIMEFADVVVITKADGDSLNAARIAVNQASQAIRWLGPNSSGWTPTVALATTQTADGINDAHNAIQQYFGHLMSESAVAEVRASQDMKWLRQLVMEGVLKQSTQSANLNDKLQRFEQEIKSGKVSVPSAAELILQGLK